MKHNYKLSLSTLLRLKALLPFGTILLLNLTLSAQIVSKSVKVDSEKSKQTASKIQSPDYLDKLLQQKSSSDYVITSAHTSKISGITHTYIRQAIHGIEVSGTESSMHKKANGTMVSANVNFIENIDKTIINTSASLTAEQAISSVSQQMGYAMSTLQIKEKLTGVNKKGVYNGAGISGRDIPVRLMYYYREGIGTHLVWELSVMEKNSSDWWNFRVDASTGKIIDKDNWTLECAGAAPASECETVDVVENTSAQKTGTTKSNTYLKYLESENLALFGGSYNVFAYPVESPSHGVRSIVTNPEDANASPFGWHDTDGMTGVEYTTTRGNNVLAQEDVNGDNGVGLEAEGGASLNFDFPIDFSQEPLAYQNAAITNLFYWNNISHDVFYQYGFDEVSGNFQQNNYGNGADGNDYVFADAQDGSGVNNANFSTPPDGLNPRMQMFLWDNPIEVTIDITAPTALVGAFVGVQADFGPFFSTTPLVGDFAVYEDNLNDSNNACEPSVNGAALNGKIVLIRRGGCTFVNKVINAQNAGAIAVVVVNNVQSSLIVMGGFLSAITIPSLMISQADGEPIIAALQSSTTVSGSATGSANSASINDSNFDNGIIVHEYGHGISNRLTGGRANTGCLSNAEQMGEGWSDYFGLMLTIEPGDTRSDRRGIGTFATGSDPLDTGIRNAPYSTDFAINDYTYGDSNDVNTVSQPHGVGFVWCTMLWDMTWDLIDVYGFDSDVYGGTGGNNKAIALVMEALKLQPCSPGFVDGRDAILAADVALNGGANACLIWEAFARRGLGASASQGSSNSRTDAVEAFDLPTTTLKNFDNLCVSDAVQVLGGGFPTGGVYSGIGVVDDGNGVSFSFDPSVNGAGDVVISYERANLCSGSPETDTKTISIKDDSIIISCQEDMNTCEPIVSYEFPRPVDNVCFSRTFNRVSQNTDETINIAIDVENDLSGHLRRFNLTTEGVLKDYLVSGIDVGIRTTTGADIMVNLYLDSAIENDITTYLVPLSDNITPYASVVSAVPSGVSFVHFVPMNVFLPAGTEFTVEVITPADQDFMLAYNNSGVLNVPNSTAATYFSASTSNILYTDLIAANFAQYASLIQVQGTESDVLTTTQTAGMAPGGTYPLGTTTNTFETTDGVNTTSCSFDVTVYDACLALNPKVFLQGALLNPNPGEETLMRDDLRVANILPTISPYSDRLTCDPSVFATTGENAVVDWVFVELRDATSNTSVVDSESALLLRNGTVVGTDGVSNLEFAQPVCAYYVAIKHRNHLGVMTAATVDLSDSATQIDFTDANNQITFGTNAQTTTGTPTGTVALWAGNANGDEVIQYLGTQSDLPSILSFVLNATGNDLNLPTFTATGYANQDVDMNGNIQYSGTAPDTSFILQNVLSHPENLTFNFSTYPIQEQLPEN